MLLLFDATRSTVTDAAWLISRHGARAGQQAADWAEQSRTAGNVRRFCHWRTVQRLIPALRCEEVTGTVH